MSEVTLATITFPPFYPLSREQIEWDSPQVIDPEYIATVHAIIKENYPQRTSRLGPSPYPDEHIRSWSSLHPKNSQYFRHKAIFNRYNPFDLRIPYRLVSLDHFFDTGCFYRGNFGVPPGYLLEKEASEQRLNFLRQYHLLYADTLEATNGCAAAKARIKKKIQTHDMYKEAGINIKHLQKENRVDNASMTFRYSLLAYLAIDILRSPVPAISTAARAKVLELLFEFDIDEIAAAFSEHCLGFVTQDNEPVEDLIPRSFMTTAIEKGGTPYNKLFAHNVKIRTLFPRLSEVNFDKGFSVLLQRHPAETVQILLSLLRCEAWSYKRKLRELVFHALVNLGQLDPIQKGDLFGVRASYRADFQRAGSSGHQSRIGATTGIGGGFGDGLESLSKAELVVRVRQHQTYEELLEQMVAAGAANMTAKRSSFTDPKGYFRLLGLDPAIGENFDLVLYACYRTMALKTHPDKNKGVDDEGRFKKVQEAYEVLRDPVSREKYLATGQ